MELVIPTFRYLAVTILLFALVFLASFLFIKPDQKGIDPAIYVDADKDQQPVTAVVSRRTGRALKPNIIVAVQTPAMLIDLFPTFMELGGLKLPADRTIDDSSLWSILPGGADNLKDRPLYFFHDFDLEAVQCDWKYYENLSTYTWPMPLNKNDTLMGALVKARNYTPAGSDVPIPTLETWPKLFNLKLDKNESYNVVERNEATAEKLRARFIEFRYALESVRD